MEGGCRVLQECLDPGAFQSYSEACLVWVGGEMRCCIWMSGNDAGDVGGGDEG